VRASSWHRHGGRSPHTTYNRYKRYDHGGGHYSISNGGVKTVPAEGGWQPRAVIWPTHRLWALAAWHSRRHEAQELGRYKALSPATPISCSAR
jgi:hypothetical protein